MTICGNENEFFFFQKTKIDVTEKEIEREGEIKTTTFNWIVFRTKTRADEKKITATEAMKRIVNGQKLIKQSLYSFESVVSSRL